MKNLLIPAIIIFVGALSAVFVLNAQFTTGAAEAIASDVVITSVSPDKFAALYRRGGYVVLDVRTPEEYAEGKVFADAKLVDFYAADFKQQLNKLERDQAYLIYCRSGNRTGETLKIMRELGFTEVYDLKGGKNAWESSGRGLVR